MTTIYRIILLAVLAASVVPSTQAQTRTGGQTQASGQLGGGGAARGGAGGQTGDAAGLPFGAGGSVGIDAQQFQTVTNSVTNATSNVLGGFYGNPLYQGRIGTTGGLSPGGFGSPLYSSGTTGGMTGAGGLRAGTGATGTRTGTSGVNTGFGSTMGTTGGRTGAGSTGTTGFGSTGTTGFGTTSGTTGFGTTGTTGGRAGQMGTTGGFGGQAGTMGGMGGRGATGTQSQFSVPGDRAVNTFYRPSSVLPGASVPMASRAQSELRGIYDRSVSLPTGKSIEIAVSDGGIVRLKGSVATDDERRMAIGLARTTPGVRNVISEITVQSKP